MAGTLPIVSSVLGIGTGLNSIFGGNTGGAAPTQVNPMNTDPWGASGGRASAATTLQSLLTNPSQALGSPGFAMGQQNQLASFNAAENAQGQTMSGSQVGGAASIFAEAPFTNWMNLVGAYSGLAGTGNANAEVGGANLNAQQQQAGYTAVGQGVGALGAALNGNSGSLPNGTYTSPYTSYTGNVNTTPGAYGNGTDTFQFGQ